MDKTLQLKIVTALQDKLSAPLKKIIGSSRGSQKSLKALRDELKGLERAQRNVKEFRSLRTGTKNLGYAVADAREKMGALKTVIDRTEGPTSKLNAQFRSTQSRFQRLTGEFGKGNQRLRELKAALDKSKISTRDLDHTEGSLKSRIESTTAAIKKQESELSRLARRERKMAAARKSMHDTQGIAANMAIAGYATRTAGRHVLGGLGNTLGQSKMVENESLRIRALGLGAGASADAVRYARSVHQRGTSESDNVQLMRDAMTIFADEHHAQMVLPTLAKMKFANEAVFGADDAQANEEKFINMLKVIELRGGTKNLASFDKEANMVQKVITATGGRVGGDQWREFIQRGGVAAKQLRPDAFYYQMEPLIQEMGGHQAGTGLMSAYSNLYQGKTTVRAVGEMMKYGLVDPKMVEYTKIGTVKRVQPGALVRGDLFKASPLEWVEQVLLPKLAAKGVTERGAINDAISSMITNRTGANLFTTMVMQAQQIHKNERLNTGADDINALASKAQDSTQGREVDLLAKLRDLKLEIGEKVSPLYNAALEKTAALTDKVVGFMKDHATAAKILVTVLAVLGGVLAVGGTLGIALASILAPMAILKFSLTTLGVQGGLASNAIRFIGKSLAFVGRLLLTNPIGLTIAAIGTAALLIYEYWDPIKTYFQGLWDKVTSFFSSGIGNIMTQLANWSPIGLIYSAFAEVLRYLGVDLPAKFTDFGSMMLQGLINGIKSMGGAVKDSIVSMGSSTIGWFKEKLGINSPSRVFIDMGGNISEGAAIGIQRRQGLAEKAAQLMASGVFAASAMSPASGAILQPPTLRFDSRPPISAQRAGGAAGVVGPGAQMVGDHIEIHIHPAAGTHPQDIAQAVARELDRRERDKMARARSALTDYGN